MKRENLVKDRCWDRLSDRALIQPLEGHGFDPHYQRIKERKGIIGQRGAWPLSLGEEL